MLQQGEPWLRRPTDVKISDRNCSIILSLSYPAPFGLVLHLCYDAQAITIKTMAERD
jgi:hypothetical protein